MLCGLVIILRAIYPNIKFDETSLILFVIAILVLLMPKDFLERLQRLKIKDFFEIELQKLREKTERAERRVEERELPEVEFEGVSTEMLEKIEKIMGLDPRAAIVIISMEIEKSLKEIFEEFRISEGKRPLSVPRMARILAERQIIPHEVVSALTDFWSIRNKVIHEYRFKLSDEQLYDIIDLGLRILKLLSLRRRK